MIRYSKIFIIISLLNGSFLSAMDEAAAWAMLPDGVAEGGTDLIYTVRDRLRQASNQLQGVVQTYDRDIQNPERFAQRLNANIGHLQTSGEALDQLQRICDPIGRQDLNNNDRATARLIAATIANIGRSVSAVAQSLRSILDHQQERNRLRNARFNERVAANVRLFLQSFRPSYAPLSPERIKQTVQEASARERSFVEQLNVLGDILGNRHYQLPDMGDQLPRTRMSMLTGRRSTYQPTVLGKINRAVYLPNPPADVRRTASQLQRASITGARQAPYVGPVVRELLPELQQEQPADSQPIADTWTEAMISTGDTSVMLHALADHLRVRRHGQVERLMDHLLKHTGDQTVRPLMEFLARSPFRPQHSLMIVQNVPLFPLRCLESILRTAANDPSATIAQARAHQEPRSYNTTYAGHIGRAIGYGASFVGRKAVSLAGSWLPFAGGPAGAQHAVDAVREEFRPQPPLWQRVWERAKYNTALGIRFVLRKIVGQDALNIVAGGAKGVPFSQMAGTVQGFFNNHPKICELLSKHDANMQSYAQAYIDPERRFKPIDETAIQNEGLRGYVQQIARGLPQEG